MTIVGLLIALVIIGLILWLVSQLPIDPTIHRIIQIVVIILVILWLAGALLGVPLLNYRIGP
jgi:ABC-type siderophore export system fused ATPase/permease subunit